MKKYKVFDFVWAKIKGHPYWPAIIMRPTSNTPKKPRSYNDELYWVLFFGTHEFAWVAENGIKEYLAYKNTFASRTRGSSFKQSVIEIEEHIKRGEDDPSDYIKLKVAKRAKPKRRAKRSTTWIRNKIEINENLRPGDTCYGVLGTGAIGVTIVNSLVKVGKQVYIWNRTERKSEILVENLSHSDQSKIKICLSPRLVMQHSNIIFNCVSDCKASTTIIERTLAESGDFMQGKGFVDMSGIDANSTVNLSKLIQNTGGKYLEVRIQHGKADGIGGGYLFLVGGNEELYKACENFLYSLGGTPVPFMKERKIG